VSLFRFLKYKQIPVHLSSSRVNVIVDISLIKRWHAEAYLVEALCYKPEGRGFNSR
jgi:hypothetical protein